MEQPQQVIVYNSQLAYLINQAGLNFVLGFLAAVAAAYVCAAIAKRLRVRPRFVPQIAIACFLLAFFAAENLK